MPRTIALATRATAAASIALLSPSRSSLPHLLPLARRRTAAPRPPPAFPRAMWTFAGGGEDQASLVDYIVRSSRGAVSSRAAAAMKRVDRKHFIGPLPESRANIYLDSPAPIGFGQTISAPHMHLSALDLLSDKLLDGARVLDVGSGSGYLLACFWAMVSPHGEVVGVEKHKPLAERSVESLRKCFAEWKGQGKGKEEENPLESGRVRVGAANVLAPGALGRGDDDELIVGPFVSSSSPSFDRGFDAIHVGAAAAELPLSLVRALRPGGRMVIPVGPDGGEQVLSVIDKDPDGKGGYTRRDLMGVRFVPLTKPGVDRHGGL